VEAEARRIADERIRETVAAQQKIREDAFASQQAVGGCVLFKRP
jgi:hypothetical protein